MWVHHKSWFVGQLDRVGRDSTVFLGKFMPLASTCRSATTCSHRVGRDSGLDVPESAMRADS